MNKLEKIQEREYYLQKIKEVYNENDSIWVPDLRYVHKYNLCKNNRIVYVCTETRKVYTKRELVKILKSYYE